MAEEVEEAKMTLTEHLDELRQRLIYAIIAVFIFAIAAYAFKEPLLTFLIRPLQSVLGIEFAPGQLGELDETIRASLSAQMCGDKPCFTPEQVELLARAWRWILMVVSGLVFIHPVEAFISYLKLSLYTGLLVGMPAVLFQVWKFVMPALYRDERKYFLSFLVFGSLLFYIGVVFCFLMILPLALQFLIGIAQPFAPMLTVGNYISFVMLFMLVFGLSFELPLVMYIVVRMGLVEHRTLVEQWRLIAVGAFVIGALFTPPDVFTQLAMASAIVILYGVGLVLTRFAARQVELGEAEVALGEGK
jgi:sec-independent protein translocase protein TatC